MEEVEAESPPDEEAMVEVVGEEVVGEEVVRGTTWTTMATSLRTTTCPSLVTSANHAFQQSTAI